MMEFTPEEKINVLELRKSAIGSDKKSGKGSSGVRANSVSSSGGNTGTSAAAGGGLNEDDIKKKTGAGIFSGLFRSGSKSKKPQSNTGTNLTGQDEQSSGSI